MSSKPVYTLISATPSPYARKVRIVLAEKGIPFTLQTEVPWDSDTKTPTYNPLEKLPVLIHNETDQAVYESHFILEWLEVKHPDTLSMIPRDADQRLLAKQIEVVADGSFRFVSFRLLHCLAREIVSMVNYKSRIMNDTRRKKEKEKLTLQHDFFFNKKNRYM